MFRAIRAKYEKGVLKPLEPIELEEGEEVLIKIEKLEDRRKIVDEFYGKRGFAPKELLDELMLEAEARVILLDSNAVVYYLHLR